MPPMSDQPLPLAALADFHRKVVVPDIERIVGDAERRLASQTARLWDALLGTRERLETDYFLIKSAMARIEERLDRMRPPPPP